MDGSGKEGTGKGDGASWHNLETTGNTHMKHLSVMGFEKQEWEKEVLALTVQREEISQSITKIQAAVDSKKRDL